MILCVTMKRRKFIQLSSLATLPLILKSCDWVSSGIDFDITVFTDIHTGHLLFESQNFPKGETLSADTLIVGGGIAGLSAATALKGTDFLLCELSDRLGGTSSFYEQDGLTFAQGAHYDLAYPANYGEDVLAMLESLNVIEYQSWKDNWSFKDEQFIINNRRESRCFQDGMYRQEVLQSGPLKEEFLKLVESHSGQMLMPTRLISEAYHGLNEVTFLDFLRGKMALDDDFVRGLDYHMLDDWGGTASQVSALAGIHYFACRPYYSQVVDLFSPPSGNGYFIDKMAAQHNSEQLLPRHLVKSLVEEKGTFKAEIVDVANRKVKEVRAAKVIYAGNKHALKYIMPEQYSLFEKNSYAPWLVLNFVLNNDLNDIGFWQNEMIMEDQTFMGFVDSNLQHGDTNGKRVLTAYYCLPPGSREDLRNVEANREVIVEKTLGYLNAYFKKDLTASVEKVFIKVMGHAMPIPTPGFLLADKNLERKYPGLTFAGVDNGRLPLLFEAMDSGIQAVRLGRA